MSNTITRAAEERARTKRRVRWGTGLAFAAVTLLGLGATWRLRTSHPNTHAPEASAFARVHSIAGTVRATHGSGTSSAALTAGEVALGAGDEVMTDQDGRGDVTLADGVTIALDGASDLRLPPSSTLAANDGKEQVRLDVGTVHIRVPHMPAGHTFSVRTPDAEVTVHGTAFTVEVAPAGASPGDGPATRVRVSEGVVSVASGGHEVLLTAGMQWPPAPIAIAPPAPASSSQPAPKSRPSMGTRHRGSAAADSIEASSLAEQNTLLAQAMDASRAGDDRHAIELLSDLLSHYPSSPLAQEARVQRFRALDRSGNHRGAAREARLYLAAYPTGFARDEAKQLALEP